jgi:hypothetical protein
MQHSEIRDNLGNEIPVFRYTAYGLLANDDLQHAHTNETKLTPCRLTYVR